MLTFLLWCLLFVICWPLALVALILYPIVWLLLLPFRIVGIAVGGVLELLWAILTLPARILRPILAEGTVVDYSPSPRGRTGTKVRNSRAVHLCASAFTQGRAGPGGASAA